VGLAQSLPLIRRASEQQPGERQHGLREGLSFGLGRNLTAIPGESISNQSRASAWHPLRWADQLNIDRLLIENVPSFRAWGPTDRRNRPIESRRGETYRQYLAMLESMGYTVEARVLNAADYGGATTRKRLFIMALKGRKRPISWPQATHAPNGGSLLPGMQPWRAAREIIDWSIPGESIFGRKRPLAKSTMERILLGLKKFGGRDLEPWLVVLRRHMAGKPITGPIPTLAANGKHVGVAEPYLINISHGGPKGHANGRTRSIHAPVPTVTGIREHAVVEPYLIHVNHSRDKFRGQPVTEPLPTITAKRGTALVHPFLLPHRTFKNMTADSLDDPMRTITANSSDFALVEPIAQPFLVPFFGERPGQTLRTHSVDEPVPTITSHGAGGVVQPVLAIVEPYLIKYNRTGGARSTTQPLDTLTTKDRYGLVTGHGIPTRQMEHSPSELACEQLTPNTIGVTS
jgi:DNA (cytosine-5)-methyltransferase 1